MTAAGLGAGVPYAIEIGDARQVPTLIGAALVYLPAIWLLTGLSALAYGLAPRALPAAWIALTACFVIGFLGEILKPPHWLIQLSPFQHTPQLPAATLSLTPLIAQTVIAATLTTLGVLAFRHRDVVG
jgi:ABC-2 type transport system permease protein